MTVLTNLILNPSVEVNTTNLAAGSNATIARSLAFNGPGESCLAITAVGAGAMSAWFNNITTYMSATVGVTYTASVWIRAATVGRGASINIRFLNAANATLTTVAGAVVTDITTDWIRYTVTGTAPATTDRVGVYVLLAGASAAEIHYADGAILTATDAAVGYFDGETNLGGYSVAWTGTAHNSTSTATSTEPTLTPFTDADPQPRILIDYPLLALGTETVTIHAIDADGDRIVAGAEKVAALGGVIKYDTQAPFGVTVTYKAEQFDAAGKSLGFTSSATTFLDVDETWFASPSNPNVCVRVEMAGQAGSSLEEGYYGQVHQIGERRILIASGGTGLDDLNMDFFTDTLDQYRQAVAVFKESKGLIVIRTPPPMQVPRVLFAWSPKPARMEWNLPAGLEDFDWDNRVQQVSPPTAQIIAAVITYGRYTAYYSTYGAFKAAYATYRAAVLSPPPEI